MHGDIVGRRLLARPVVFSGWLVWCGRDFRREYGHIRQGADLYEHGDFFVNKNCSDVPHFVSG
jgi:hypothetical protein